jgi:capsule polysaccharide export protein KpsE/RkpR
MSYATREELNRAFFKEAKIRDEEAKLVLLKAGEELVASHIILDITNNSAIDKSISIVKDYIWKNVAAEGKLGGFKKLKKVYSKKKQGYARIKDLTVESQYIEFYDLYKDDFEAEFDEKTYDQAVILMADWI